MNSKEWNEGLGHIDPDLVDEYIEEKDKIAHKRKTKGVLLRVGAIAACLALIVGAIIVVPMLRENGSGIVTPPDEIDPTLIIFDANVSPEKLNGNNLEFIEGSSISVGGGYSEEPPRFEFETSNFVVKAKVVKNHPDLYYKLDVHPDYKPSAYRLVQMVNIEVIHGENVPQYFLYLIPNSLFVDMSVYDSLLISMSQIGTENYVLKNGLKNQMEAFDLPIFADHHNSPELGNIIAFNNGIFDESLWQTESWKYGYHRVKDYLDNPGTGNLVVSRGDSQAAVITKIKSRIAYTKKYEYWYKEPTFVSLNFSTQDAKDAIEYVKPFENGVFSQTYEPYYSSAQLIFRRYINGCQTEETITIDLSTEQVTYSEVRYTDEDMSKLVNISVYLSQKANEYTEQMPIPPHTDPEGKGLLCLNLYAWYAKVDGKLYGIIKTAWRYKEKDNWYIQYYDDSYILYDMTGPTKKEISRDNLIKIVGTRNVYLGEYGVGILMPME